MDSKPILTVKNLKASYKDHTVLKDINFSIFPGEVVGLLGPNGSGKTTLFHTLLGFLKQDFGHIFLQEQEISFLSTYARTSLGMGYLPQESSVFQTLTVEDNVLCVLETEPLSKKERLVKLEEILQKMRLHTLRKKKAQILSGGEKRRVEIARLLVRKPKILLLDEPFANIDPITIDEIKKLIYTLKNHHISVLITDHNAREICKTADRTCILADSTIVAEGLTEDILEDEKARLCYFGKSFSL